MIRRPWNLESLILCTQNILSTLCTLKIYNEKACAAAKKYHGYFVLIASREKDTFEALRKYRKREHIEDYFRSSKQHADSIRVRVWDPDTLRTKRFSTEATLRDQLYLERLGVQHT